VNFLISKRARRHVETIQAWWSKNRPSSPGLFLEELYEVERRLRDNPSLGVVYVAHRSGVVRRVLLVRTKRHVYFRFHAERDELVVLDPPPIRWTV
jgi:plasmid stabilization system protein ParE